MEHEPCLLQTILAENDDEEEIESWQPDLTELLN